MNFRSTATVLLACFLLMTAIPFPLYAEENRPVDRGDGVLENDGDWIIEEGDDLFFENETIIINGNLTIDGILSLVDCELIMNMSEATISVIGELDLENTNISGFPNEYYFIVNGTLRSKDCHFKDIKGDSFPFVGGLQIYSEDVYIDGGSIIGNEYAGIYITTNITLRNITIEDNEVNVVIEDASPQFHDCFMKVSGSDSIYLFNRSSPYFVGGEHGSILMYDENTSYSHGHRLSVHVTYDNGTPISGVNINVESTEKYISRNETTDANGWVREMILPEETVYKKSGMGDRIYNPYLVTAEKFGLQVVNRITLESDTEVEVVLSGDYFGEALTRGDFNGDGFMDLAVGVPRNLTGLTTTGAVFIFLNDRGLEFADITESMADLMIKGAEGTGFGSVINSGDINGDGFDDLIVSSPFSSDNGAGSGRVHFFYGNPEPAWNDLSDAAFTFDGDPGSHYGKTIFVGNINNDEFSDFVIGDDLNSYVYHSTANPGEDFSRISELYAAPTAKGASDTTGESLSKITQDDDNRYEVKNPETPNNKMHIRDFIFTGIIGEITTISMQIQFSTEQWYGYSGDERSYIYYRIGEEGDWQESLRPRYNQQNWRDETTWTYDLVADGITTIEQLEEIEFYFENTDADGGGQNNEYDIFFDYILIHVIAVPSGANNTLEAGNVSSGDVNGDGYPDLIISDTSGQTIYFGGPLGLSAPEILETDLTKGNTSNLRVVSGDLTISETRPYLNGQFDDGWDGWQQVANSRGQKDGSTRWDIVDTANGDWDVHEGPTGGFGVNQDTLDGDNNRDCRGMMRTKDFLVTDDMETIHFWYDFGARSFERAGGWQGDYADQIRYRLYSAGNNSVLMELAGWAPTSSSDDHDENGMVDANISHLRGEMVYYGFEIITNRGNSDRGIAQIDNLTILPASDIPYYENGSLESEWIVFEGNISTYTPSWVQDTNNGTLSVKFRTDNVTEWDDISEFTSGDQYVEDDSSNVLQYRIEMTGDGTVTPTMSDLSLAILLEGQIIPLSLATDFGHVSTADLNGDGIDDLLFYGEGGGGSQRGKEGLRGNGDEESKGQKGSGDEESRGQEGSGDEERKGQDGDGQGIDVYYGDPNLSEEYNASDIQDFYGGEIAGFSVLDLDLDGSDELAIIGTTINIIDSNTDLLWEKSVNPDRISGDVAGNPFHNINTGEVYFIPSHDINIRVIDISSPQFIDPDEQLTINVTVGNIGINALSDLTAYINITADGYSYSDTHELSLEIFESVTFGVQWDAPAEEGIPYTITVEIPVHDDRIQADNEFNVTTTSKQHIIRLLTDNSSLSAHGGDPLVYLLTIENIGTFETENVTLASTLPQDWNGEFRYQDVPVDFIIVTDSEELSFVAWSQDDEEQDDYIINLTTTAETAMSGLDLTATILRPDLIINEILLLRADGVSANDSIHGVEGDVETIRVNITNQADTYSTEFTLNLSISGLADEDFQHPGLGPGESVWFSTQRIPEEGTLTITAHVDSLDAVPENNESNNFFTEEFTIKGTEPVGPYQITGVIQDISGEGVGFAEVRFEWEGNEEQIYTDENGNFSYNIEAIAYADASLLYLNGSDGQNITSIKFHLYSEDGGKHLVLTLNQYLVEVEGPDAVSTIDLAGTITIDLEIFNRGNINTTFIVEASEVPMDWSVTVLDLPGSAVALAIDESTTVTIEITSSSDPRYSLGYNKYYVSILVYAELYAPANDSFTHGIEVLPVGSLNILVDGENTSSAKPGDMLEFSFIVENHGNEGNTFIPELLGSSVQTYNFNITHASIEIAGQASFSLTFIMPHIASGTDLILEVGGTEEYIANAEIVLTSLDYYGVNCESDEQFEAKPGDTLSIPLTVQNTGNLLENISITGRTNVPGVEITDGYAILAMGEETSFSLKVKVPDNALYGDVIPLTINLSTGPTYVLSLSLDITVIEVSGISLVLSETTIIPDSDFTIYNYEIEALNSGNGQNTFYFKAVGTHPRLVNLPDPVTLDAGEMEIITAQIIVPLNHSGFIDIFLVPLTEDDDYGDLNLRILFYAPDLDIVIVTSQEESVYYYDVSVTNNGDRFERLEIIPGIPAVGNYELGDLRWAGEVNKDLIEILPGETEHFRMWVTTPDNRDYWGSDLSLTLKSDSGQSEKIILHKPPIPILDHSISEPITFEDVVSFSGSRSYWNIIDYQWDFGDGSTGTGSSLSHSFRWSGEHLVTLTITDDGNFTATQSILVEVENMAPIAHIQIKPQNRTVEVGQPVRLDASFSLDRDGTIVNYQWEFEEYGSFYEGYVPIIEYKFENVGNYTITLFVTDNGGIISEFSLKVMVIPVSEDSGGDTTGDTEENTTTDPLSYIPAALAVVIILVGVILILRKKIFVNYIFEKIDYKIKED